MIHIPPRDAPWVWPKVELYIRAALEYGGGKFQPHDWLARILLGQADLFMSDAEDFAAVAEAQQFPLVRVYVLVLGGGERNGEHDWDDVRETIHAAAAARGCSKVEIYGRPGWGAILTSRGYEHAHSVWRSEV